MRVVSLLILAAGSASGGAAEMKLKSETIQEPRVRIDCMFPCVMSHGHGNIVVKFWNLSEMNLSFEEANRYTGYRIVVKAATGKIIEPTEEGKRWLSEIFFRHFIRVCHPGESSDWEWSIWDMYDLTPGDYTFEFDRTGYYAFPNRPFVIKGPICEFSVSENFVARSK